jgi:hypothetical protein
MVPATAARTGERRVEWRIGGSSGGRDMSTAMNPLFAAYCLYRPPSATADEICTRPPDRFSMIAKDPALNGAGSFVIMEMERLGALLWPRLVATGG